MGDKVGENPDSKKTARRRFLAIREKPQGGGVFKHHHPPAGRRLTHEALGGYLEPPLVFKLRVYLTNALT